MFESKADRRRVITGISALGVAGIIGPAAGASAEPPPEVRTLRMMKSPVICFAPHLTIEPFLRVEGFDGIDYVETGGGFSASELVVEGKIDISTSFAGTVVYRLDQGWPITAIGGMHVGCYELFAREPINSIGDLKGRRVGITTMGSSAHLYVSIMATSIGLDPKKDIDWVTAGSGSALESYAAGETDAFLGFPPEPQELRSRGVDRVIINTVLDHPWSQYFCCMQYAHRDFVRNNPVATKRFLRATYRAAAFCTMDPVGAARQIVDGGFTESYEHALETVRLIPYDLWHDYDSEDTLRFYALNLHNAGMLDNHPRTLIARGTEWRFLEELKRELRT
jgi:NitT/TauT family transport system substrate-binding protein